MDLPTAIEKYWTHAGLVVGGLFTAWKATRDAREKRRADALAAATARHVAKLDLAKFAQEAVGDAVEILRAEVRRLSDELAEARAEARARQSEHIQMIAGKDAELAVARGQIRQLETRADAYRRLLVEHEIGVPATFDAQQVKPDGNLKVMGALE